MHERAAPYVPYDAWRHYIQQYHRTDGAAGHRTSREDRRDRTDRRLPQSFRRYSQHVPFAVVLIPDDVSFGRQGPEQLLHG